MEPVPICALACLESIVTDCTNRAAPSQPCQASGLTLREQGMREGIQPGPQDLAECPVMEERQWRERIFGEGLCCLLLFLLS